MQDGATARMEQLEYTHRLVTGGHGTYQTSTLFSRMVGLARTGMAKIKNRSPRLVCMHSDAPSQPQQPVYPYSHSRSHRKSTSTVPPPHKGPQSFTNPYGI